VQNTLKLQTHVARIPEIGNSQPFKPDLGDRSTAIRAPGQHVILREFAHRRTARDLAWRLAEDRRAARARHSAALGPAGRRELPGPRSAALPSTTYADFIPCRDARGSSRLVIGRRNG
jgi:hypothetical protein